MDDYDKIVFTRIFDECFGPIYEILDKKKNVYVSAKDEDLIKLCWQLSFRIAYELELECNYNKYINNDEIDWKKMNKELYPACETVCEDTFVEGEQK